MPGGGGGICPPSSHPLAAPRAVVYLTRQLLGVGGMRWGGCGVGGREVMGKAILGLPALSVLGKGGSLHHPQAL